MTASDTTTEHTADRGATPGYRRVETLHLGCGTDYKPHAWNVDADPSVDPDEVVDLEAVPWPWPANEYQRVEAHHVIEHLGDIESALREIHRVLEPGGIAVVSVPFGVNEDADPQHKWGRHGRPWRWRTPEYYCGARSWDQDVGLTVTDRDCDVWSLYPKTLGAIHNRVLAWKMQLYGPGAWCFAEPHASGEFIVTFTNE